MNESSKEKIEKSPEECTTGRAHLAAVIGMLAGFFAAHVAEVFPVRAELLLWHHRLVEALDLVLFVLLQLGNHHGETALVTLTSFQRLDLVAEKRDGAGK